MSGTSRWHRTRRAISRQSASARALLDGPAAAPTETDARRAMMLAITTAEAIRTAGQIPSGTIYAMMLGWLSLEAYESIIDSLVGAGLIRKDESHLLTWIGPHIREEGQ